jgi:hypothetical protein
MSPIGKIIASRFSTAMESSKRNGITCTGPAAFASVAAGFSLPNWRQGRNSAIGIGHVSAHE